MHSGSGRRCGITVNPAAPWALVPRESTVGGGLSVSITVQARKLRAGGLSRQATCGDPVAVTGLWDWSLPHPPHPPLPDARQALRGQAMMNFCFLIYKSSALRQSASIQHH